MSYANWRLSVDYDALERMAGALMTEANVATTHIERAYYMGGAEALYALLDAKNMPDKDSIPYMVAPALRGLLQEAGEVE